MKTTSAKKISLAAFATLAGITGFVHDTHAAIVINEVYGGGGSAATTGLYNTDYIELYNNGLTPVDLTGLAVRYASATGAFNTSTNGVGVLSGILNPGGFYLVAGATAATNGGPALPVAADATSNIAASASAGKVALFAADGTTVLDLVAYGTTSTGGEGLAPAPTLSSTLAAYRIIDGVDTNQNGVDFAAGGATPRATNVPEPAAMGLAAVGAAVLVRRRRRA